MASRSTTRAFPGFSRVYVLGEHGGSRAFRGDIELSVDHAFAVTRAELQPELPVRILWFMGNRTPTDVVWTTIAAPLVLHDRVVETLRAQGFSGWATYPVELRGKGDEPITSYHGLAVPGRCGPIDNSRSIQVPRRFPAGTFPVWKGLYFDPDTWDGADLFMPAGRVGCIFVVEQVKRALERVKVRNVTFTPLDEEERAML